MKDLDHVTGDSKPYKTRYIDLRVMSFEGQQ